MKLNRRYRRSIRANLPFYLSASVLTMVTLLMFYLFYIAGTGINDYGDSFFSTYHCEDASFTTVTEIPEEELEELSKKYGLTMEKEHFANVDEGSYRTRVFSPNQKIDLYEIQSGKDLSGNGEILISEGYAQENHVSAGDRIMIGGKSYQVAGTFLRPDYLYMVENISDSYKNVTTFFLAYMTAEEFQNQFGDGSIQYKVRYGSDTDSLAFRREINEKYYMASYLDVAQNKRITFVHEQADMFIMSSWFILTIFPLMTVALVCILLGRRVRAEQKLIGTLSALGYTRAKLMHHYSLFAVIPGIAGGILTTVAALLLAKPFGSLGLADYEPMKPHFSLPLWVAVAGLVVPALIYYTAGMLRVRKLLRKDTVALLSGQIGNSGRNRRFLSKKKMPVKRKFALRQLIGNPGRSLVIFLGIFLGAMIVAFAYSFVDSVKAVGKQAHEEFGSFRYEYIFNNIKDGTPDEGEAALLLPYEDRKSRNFTLMGLDENTTLWNLKTIEGTMADLEHGYYISTLAEAIFDIHPGDEFTFRNIATLEEYRVKIDGVIKNGYQSYLLTSRKNVCNLAGFEKECYNALLSDRELELEASELTETITDQTYQDQMDNMMTSMGGLVYAFMGIGMIVCICSLYATINTMMTENGHNISMLKVLGFDNRRIHSMVISANHLLLLPGIILGTASAYGFMVWYCEKFVEVETIMIPASLAPRSVFMTALLTIGSYGISLLLLRNKVERADLVEALKDGKE